MPYTLLLADDSVTIQRVIELTFADEDVRVVAVGDGDEAIAFLDRTPPDIVLADIGMLRKSGYEVAQHMRDTPGLADIPVVLLTGAFEPVDEARAKEVGCDAVLAKPFEPQQVISRVKELLARPKRAAPSLDVLPSPAPQPAPSWPQVVDDAPSGRSDVAASESADRGHYFDRLDAALASRSNAGRPDAVSTPSIPVEAVDWLSASPAGSPPADLPLAYPPPPPATAASVPPPAPAALSPTLPPLADAFAALLAAEQSAPPPPAAPAWPATAAPAAPVSEEIIENVTRRVLDRLSDRVVRETVNEIVSKVAERLVREEIERIKSSIK